MMISFENLTKPIDFNDNNINVLCIENKKLYRNVVNSFYNENPEEQNIFFSEDYNPFKFRGNICFVNDFYNLSISSSVIKKLYDEIAVFCNNELQEETTNIKSQIIKLIDLVIKNFDYDFNYNLDVNLQDLFKIQNVKPAISNVSLLSSLLDYILVINKYIAPKCFLLLNLHLYFNELELSDFYKELTYNNINIFVVENNKNFETNIFEKVTIIDNDLCEIIEN